MCAPRLAKSLTTLSESMVLTVAKLEQLNAKNTLEEYQLVYAAADNFIASFASDQKSALNRVRESKPAAEKTKKDKKAKKAKKVQLGDSESNE